MSTALRVMVLGRYMSRHQALRNWSGRNVVDELRGRSILIRRPSMRGDLPQGRWRYLREDEKF